MEPKLITVEIMNNHPKLMRLPSVSRSLYFSILPKSCYEMYENPVILAMNPKTSKSMNPPTLSRYRNTRTKQTTTYEARPMIKPSRNSYIYNKMFSPKPEIIAKPPPKRSKSRPQTTQNPRNVTFYCEVNPPKSAPKRSELPRSLNHTLMELGDISNTNKPHNNQKHQSGLMVDKEMEIDMNLSLDSIEDLHKISEVHSSLEISVDDEDVAKSFSHLKRKRARK